MESLFYQYYRQQPAILLQFGAFNVLKTPQEEEEENKRAIRTIYFRKIGLMAATQN